MKIVLSVLILTSFIYNSLLAVNLENAKIKRSDGFVETNEVVTRGSQVYDLFVSEGLVFNKKTDVYQYLRTNSNSSSKKVTDDYKLKVKSYFKNNSSVEGLDCVLPLGEVGITPWQQENCLYKTKIHTFNSNYIIELDHISMENLNSRTGFYKNVLPESFETYDSGNSMIVSTTFSPELNGLFDFVMNTIEKQSSKELASHQLFGKILLSLKHYSRWYFKDAEKLTFERKISPLNPNDFHQSSLGGDLIAVYQDDMYNFNQLIERAETLYFVVKKNSGGYKVIVDTTFYVGNDILEIGNDDLGPDLRFKTLLDKGFGKEEREALSIVFVKKGVDKAKAIYKLFFNNDDKEEVNKKVDLTDGLPAISDEFVKAFLNYVQP